MKWERYYTEILFKKTTDVKIPPTYDSFILFDYTYEKKSIITSAEAKECIKSLKHWFGDGTCIYLLIYLGVLIHFN